LFKIVDSKKQFLTNGYRAAGQSFKDKAAKQKEKAKKSGSTAPTPTVRRQPGPGKAKGEWMKIIQILKQKNLLPAVAFAFSKNKCMELATGLASSDLTSAAEKSEIHSFIEVSIKKLKGTDKTLPQVIHMRELLKRGIGVHHGGLLPLMKEVRKAFCD
jgi:antiviral helicase SKI2